MESSQQSQEVPQSQPKTPSERTSRTQKMSSKAARHVARKAVSSSRDMFYQTTLEERVVLLASIAAIIISFFPWAVSTAGGSIVEVSGVTSFLYLMGVLVIISGVTAILSVFWLLFEKPFPRFFGSPAKLHIILGAEITQIGLIAYTMFQAAFTLTQDLEGKSGTIIALIVCGVAIMGAGIFEQNKQRRQYTSKVMPTHHHIHDHEQSDRELETIFNEED